MTIAADAAIDTYELVAVERSFSKGGITVNALRGIDLVIKSGEIVALEGPSGSGKSTLLQLLGALDLPTKGSSASQAASSSTPQTTR